MIFVAITKDRQGGYRARLSDGPNRTRPIFQSAAQSDRANARRDVERLFGKLDWVEPAALGISLEFVIEAARVIVLPLAANE